MDVPLTEDQTPTRRPQWCRPVAALLMAGQGAGLGILGVVLLIRTIFDGGSEIGRSVTFDALLLVFAAGAVVIAVACWRGSAASRTPTVLWNLFGVLVGSSLTGGGAPGLGIGVIAVSVVTLGAGLAAPLNS